MSFLKHAGVGNVVWLTADMHYISAHYYDPNHAVFQDFEAFWEFVSGPLHAGTWSPGKLDNTFGPQAMYRKGYDCEQGDNLAQTALQRFRDGMTDGHSNLSDFTAIQRVRGDLPDAVQSAHRGMGKRHVYFAAYSAR